MGPFLRIGLRYAGGALVAKGFVSHDVGDLIAGDPDIYQAVEIGAGLAMAGAAEYWYMLAKRLGWSK